MRYLTLALVAICGFYFPSARQIKDKPEPPDQEIVRLRQLLNIPPEKPIKFSLSKELPNENPFKVYGLVVSRLDLNDSQQATKTWVENWNKKNANKYGALEAATNISEADLIFLWLVYPEEAISSALSQLGYN